MTKKKDDVPRETLEQKQLKGIGRALRTARLDQSLNLQTLEGVCGVSSLTISKLERGQLDNCSLQTLNKIAEALKLCIGFTVTPKN